MATDVRAELEYMAQHVTAEEFRAAALAEVGRMQAELERLRAIEVRAQAMCDTTANIGDWKTAARHILTGPDPRRPTDR